MKKVIKKINGKTTFEREWGLHIKELAKQEDVTPEALHMRVRNYGSPYQRAPKPSAIELMYGKTTVQLAIELDCTTSGLINRIRHHGDAYYTSNYQHNQGRLYSDVDWREERRFGKPQGWLHPAHPAYKNWRITVLEHIAKGKTLEQAVELLMEEHREVK